MKILIVEDEPKIAQALRRGLQIQKYQVEVAQDGKVGLDLAMSGEFDLIVLDVMLPVRDGVSVCRELRAQEVMTPILMLTAKGMIADKVAALDSGADDYLVKPFSFEELFSRVRALLRRSHPPTKLLHVGELKLDPEAKKVTVGGRVVPLSNKEFTLLEYLLLHAGTVLSKQTIIDQVWNYDADVLPQSVEVHVKHIRDKIDAGRTSSFIETVRGFGYVIREQKA